MSFVPSTANYGINPAIPAPPAGSGTTPIPGPNPAVSAAPQSPITASAQGMPAPAAVGSYTPGPQANKYGSWGGASENGGVAGNTNGSPQGAPSSSGSGWSYSAPGSSAAGSTPAGSNIPGGANPASAYTSAGGGAGYVQGNGVKYASTNGYGGQSPWVNSDQAAGNWLKALGDPTTGIYGAGSSALGAADGGPIPGIPHTSKAVSFDDGGGVPDDDSDAWAAGGLLPGSPKPQYGAKTKRGSFDNGGSVPDPGGAIPDDPSDPSDVSDTSPTVGGDSSQTGGDESSQIMSAIYNTLSYGRQKSGLSDAIINQVYGAAGAQSPANDGSPDGDMQVAGNIPGKPAGPGGDQPNTNPFPTKTPSPPFGQRSADAGDADQPTQVAANTGPIQPGPNGPPVKGALQPAPFNPRDYLPGGSKASDSGIPDDTETA